VPTRVACEQLHISRFTLLRLKNNYRRLQGGIHWLRISPTTTAPILWNIEAIRESMAEWSSERSETTTKQLPVVVSA
jgi:hypothetical protein